MVSKHLKQTHLLASAEIASEAPRRWIDSHSHFSPPKGAKLPGRVKSIYTALFSRQHVVHYIVSSLRYRPVFHSITPMRQVRPVLCFFSSFFFSLGKKKESSSLQ